MSAFGHVILARNTRSGYGEKGRPPAAHRFLVDAQLVEQVVGVAAATAAAAFAAARSTTQDFCGEVKQRTVEPKGRVGDAPAPRVGLELLAVRHARFVHLKASHWGTPCALCWLCTLPARGHSSF